MALKTTIFKIRVVTLAYSIILAFDFSVGTIGIRVATLTIRVTFVVDTRTVGVRVATLVKNPQRLRWIRLGLQRFGIIVRFVGLVV